MFMEIKKKSNINLKKKVNLKSFKIPVDNKMLVINIKYLKKYLIS